MFDIPIEADPRVKPDMTHCLKCGFFLSEAEKTGIEWKHCLKCGAIYTTSCPDVDWSPASPPPPEPLKPSELRRLQRIMARAWRARRGEGVDIEVVE